MKAGFWARMTSVVVTGAVLFAGCDLLDNGKDDDKNTAGATVTPGATQMMAGTYQATTLGGKTVIISTMTTPASIDTFRECHDTTLVTVIDTTPAETETDTAVYELNGNVLTIVEEQDTIGSAVVQEISVFKRKGSGTGLEGVWQFDSAGYKVISGTLAADDKAELDGEMVENNAMLDAMGMEILLTSNEIKFYVSPNMAPIMMIAFQELMQDTCLDAAIAPVSATSVKITGNKSGEIVTITFTQVSGIKINMDMDYLPVNITYSSSDAGHATHTYYANPTQCPNEIMPDWLMEFYLKNYKASCMGGFQKRPARIPSFGGLRAQKPAIRFP